MQLMTMNKLEWHLNQNKINYLSKTKIFHMNLYNILNSNLAYYLNDYGLFVAPGTRKALYQPLKPADFYQRLISG